MARSTPLLALAVLAASLCGCADLPASRAQVDSSPSTQLLKKLPRKNGELPVVTIHEFRSSVPDLAARATTDQFKTALVHSGQFRVVERGGASDGVLREKQMNAQGLTAGDSAQQALRPAQYVFEGTVSEANAGQAQRSGAVNVAGAELGGGTNRDVLAIDVRVIDARTGDVLDAITVSQVVKSDSVGVSGLGALASTILAQRGKATTYVPDARYQQQRREGVDAALRSLINTAVAELAKRFQP